MHKTKTVTRQEIEKLGFELVHEHVSDGQFYKIECDSGWKVRAELAYVQYKTFKFYVEYKDEYNSIIFNGLYMKDAETLKTVLESCPLYNQIMEVRSMT